MMTLGGLALAVGILVDEATVSIENIHTQMRPGVSKARAVLEASRQTAIARLLAMLCVLAVFVPSFFMTGVSRQLFVPLSLAVAFSMIASYVLSSTLVPVFSTWLLKEAHGDRREGAFRTPALALFGVIWTLCCDSGGRWCWSIWSRRSDSSTSWGRAWERRFSRNPKRRFSESGCARLRERGWKKPNASCCGRSM